MRNVEEGVALGYFFSRSPLTAVVRQPTGSGKGQRAGVALELKGGATGAKGGDAAPERN